MTSQSLINSNLDGVAVECCTVAHLTLSDLFFFGVVLWQTIIINGPLVAAGIFAAEVEGHKQREDEGHGDSGREGYMARDKSGQIN